MLNKTLYKKSKLYGTVLKLLGFERGISSFIDRLDLDCPNNSRILDVGCGTGVVGLQLMERFPKSTLLASDIEKKFLNETIKNSKKRNISKNRISVGLSDITTPNEVKLLDGPLISLKPKSFDIVCVGGAIGYSKNQEKTIRKLLGLLKPAGYFLNIEENENPIGRKLASMFHYPIMPLNKMKKIIENEGYKVSFIHFSASDFPVNLTRIGIIARKYQPE